MNNRICKKCKKEYKLDRKGCHYKHLCDDCLDELLEEKLEYFEELEFPKEIETREYAYLPDGTWYDSQDLEDYHFEMDIKFIKLDENLTREDVTAFIRILCSQNPKKE